MLTERVRGSQLVGCAGVVQPTLTSRFPCGGVAVKFGSGPRVTPSHAALPGVQPLEKKKQACPFAPEMLRPSTAPREEDGSGHHGSNGNRAFGLQELWLLGWRAR